MADIDMPRSQTVRYTILASEHAGGDFVLWLRYLSKWVNPSGHIFSEKDIARIMQEKRITPFQKTILSEAITPGTPTNAYVVKLRTPRGKAEILEIERRLRDGEQVY
ncbi:MAG: hypothetical protein FWE98_02310 [Oscillospiraceae bacterium]|nr:hypothetical protein [Oscillospiraceae bacterium]